MIKPLKTKKDYEASLQRCYDLIQKNIKPNTPDADELEVLSILVENYEQKHYPVPPPNPVDAIKYRLQQTGIDVRWRGPDKSNFGRAIGLSLYQ